MYKYYNGVKISPSRDFHCEAHFEPFGTQKHHFPEGVCLLRTPDIYETIRRQGTKFGKTFLVLKKNSRKRALYSVCIFRSFPFHSKTL